MSTQKQRLSSNKESPQLNTVRSASTPQPQDNWEGLSPELVPIVTLLSSQTHRRYTEGIFMLYYDLNGDGKPADREWKEVYGILTGNQLAYWDAANLAQFKNNPSALLETSSKPNYINFTDAVYNAMKVLPAAKQNLDNVIIVSTTLKNRYILQFKSFKDLTVWYSALRLSNFEYSSLQEAYTGALLSARGSRLSDIRTILAEKRFDHEDWVSIRYGSGMAWKRCYAVVEPSSSKKKSFTPGRILFFENEQKKKKQLMAVVTNAVAVAAIYPQSHQLIDHSTMLKLEGFINFTSPSLSTKVPKKTAADFKQTSIFLMPEQHSAVPGFDTLIRFIVPLLDSFGLYGRPKRLKADRNDPDSLLFGLPTLPRVHYLELDDVIALTKGDFLNWDLKTWTGNIKHILKNKLDKGYEGCGSQRGYQGAVTSLNSPVISSGSPRLPSKSTPSSLSQSSQKQAALPPTPIITTTKPPPPGPDPRIVNKGFDKNVNDLSIGVANKAASGSNLQVDKVRDNHKSIQLSEIYQKYSELKNPGDEFGRANLLNGSHERIAEADLPAGIRQMDLGGNVYPKDDDGLFSDEEEDEEGEIDPGVEAVDVRQIGYEAPSTPSMGSLKLPYSDDRAGSYSSVASPMAQFNDFKETYKNQTQRKNPYPNNSDDDEDDDSDLAPPVPSHDTKYSHPYQGNLSSVSMGVAASRSSAGKESVHSEVGRMSKTNRPRYISSPNASQNSLNNPTSRRSPLGKATVQYPVSPERLANVTKSSDNLNDAMQLPSLPPMQQKQYSPSPPPKQQVQPQQARSQSPYQQQTQFQQQQQQQPQQRQQPPPSTQQPGYPLSGQQYQQQQRGYAPQQARQNPPPPQQQPQPHPYQQYYNQQPPQQSRSYPPPPQQQQQQPQPQGQYGRQQPQASQYGPSQPQYGRSQPPPQQQQYGRPQPQNYPSQGPTQSRGTIPRSNGQPSLAQHQRQQQQQQPNTFRGYDQQQQQQYAYVPQTNQPRPHLQSNNSQGRNPYPAQYSDQYGNGSSRYY
ncbi:SKG3 Protein SKG3 [Candida maltosa Xu316]